MLLANFIKQYAIFILGAFIIILLSASYFLVWPEYQDYRVIKREFSLKDEEIKAKEEYLPKLIAISKRLEEEAGKIEIINSALPSDPSVAALYDYFEKTTSQNGLILDEIDVSTLFIDEENPVESTDEMGEMVFSATLIGSYESFKGFLTSLYLSARMIEVKSIQLSSLEGEESSGDILTFELGLKTQSHNETNNYDGGL